MSRSKPILAVTLASLMAVAPHTFAANHREAPLTALDRAADITDFFAFVSYDDPNKVTFILYVDPLLEPGNGPNYYPFDPEILYAIKIDNDNDAIADVTFEFRFTTEIRAPGLFTGFVGAGSGIDAPANAPPGGPRQIVPRAITALDGAGSEGLSLRQNYTITMVRGSGEDAVRTVLTDGMKLFAVPTNVGPRTMPNYSALARQGIYSLDNGIRVFTGTVDDPFYIDLGAAFDSLNFRPGAFMTGVTGVMAKLQDLDNTRNYAPDYVAGYNVNSIAIEVPTSMLVRTGHRVVATDPAATIGAWATTSRPAMTIRRAPEAATSEGPWRQIQRMGNPLINELIIGTGSKDRFSMSEPKDDAQFAAFALDPLLARVFNAVFGISVPPPPRVDLLPLVQYMPPIAAAGTEKGPVADLLRLNTGVPATPQESRSRLGLLAGDPAGFPNGRRVFDDVTDIASRAVAGVLAGPPYNDSPNNMIGDAVNVNDVPLQQSFPYVGWAQSGRDRRVNSLGAPQCVLNPNACR